MKAVDTIRKRIEALRAAPGEELGRWARFLRFQIRLWRFCGRRLREHNAVAMSSALSFRTIFALVPVLVLALVVVKSVGGMGDRDQERYRHLPYVGILRPEVYMPG